jgi:release factor glutamine methyltransferase
MPSLLSDIADRLAPLSDTAYLDASVLLANTLEKPRSWVLAHPEVILTEQQQAHLDRSLARLESGEPFPYVLGHWEFFGLDFEITPDVLIPRPETELLVEKAIVWLQGYPGRRTVADIGTGSGAIAVSLTVNVALAHVLATDISPRALQVAQRNALRFNVDQRVEFVQCDILPSQHQMFPARQHLDLLCANLPYIPTKVLQGLPVYGREPTVALDGGEDGLLPYRKLLALAPDWLAPHALILLEIEATQGVQAVRLAHDMFPRAEIHLHKDLTGLDRLLEIAT